MNNSKDLIESVLHETKLPVTEAVSKAMVTSRLNRVQQKEDDCKQYLIKVQQNMLALSNAVLHAKSVISSTHEEDAFDKLDRILDGMMDDLTDFTQDLRNAVADSNSFVRSVAKMKDAL